MTVALIAVALAVAVIDWWSVATDRAATEEWAKPLVMVVLIAATLAAMPDGDQGLLLLIALGLGAGLVGDVALLPRFDQFIVGLGAFFVGHLFYVAAFARDSSVNLVGAVIALALFVTAGRRILFAVRGTKLHIPVTLYVAIIVVMVVFGTGTSHLLVGIGAVLFAASDGLLGHDRFVTPRHDRRVFVHMLYHLGQAAIVAGVLQA